MTEPGHWSPPLHSRFTLVAGFADFYQEVARIKQAQTEGRLAAYLAGTESPAPVLPLDFARLVSARLRKQLQEQERQCTAEAASEAGKLAAQARYLMAALADEVLIFELDWPGRDVWLTVLLEQSMFNTSNAGSRFFSMAKQLVQDNIRSPLHMDLAAVFLLAMELGFRGCWRARQGEQELAAIRQQLYQLVVPAPADQHARNGMSPPPAPAFSQAYAYLLRGFNDERLAPVSPWRNLGIYGLVSYLLASSLLWLALMYPFERYLGS
jgi:type VI secretion system protein ImpK